MLVLKAENLRKIYGKGENQVKALDGVELSVEKGEFAAVVGTSGSGNWAGFNNNGEITAILDNTSLSDEEKKTKINQVIYPQVTALLNSTDEDAWGSFRNDYYGCVTVG